MAGVINNLKDLKGRVERLQVEPSAPTDLLHPVECPSSLLLESLTLSDVIACDSYVLLIRDAGRWHACAWAAAHTLEAVRNIIT